MGNDIIANMITSIRNANLGKIKTVQIPATNATRDIAKILLREGFIEDFIDNEQNANFLMLNLKYQGKKKKSYITTLRRISKPGLRIYSNHREIPKVLGGMGIVILSTSGGIMTDREAREKKNWRRTFMLCVVTWYIQFFWNYCFYEYKLRGRFSY